MTNDNNPWAGLASYEDPSKSERKLKFCGRDNDIYDVTRLIDDNLLLILYGKSGIGKTSLLNAGVFPKLRLEQYLPVSIRLGTLEASASYQEAIISAVENAIEEVHGSITVFNVVEEQTDNQQPDCFWNYFARHHFVNAEKQPLFPVVVFDQFEEVLRNISPKHVGKAQTLLNQLQYLIDESHALSDCIVDGKEYFYDFNFRFVVSIREDELYLLEDNVDDLALSMFKNCRYRLRSLSEQGATEAILVPGKDCIADEEKQAVVDRIIKLSKRPQSNDIDTLLLSLVCAGTYDKKVGEKIITLDLAVWGNNPMRIYYDEAILSLQDNQIRFIQKNLIKKDGTRKRVKISELKEAVGDDIFDKISQGSNRILNILPNEEVELLHDQLALAIYDDREVYEERERNWKLMEMQSRFVAEKAISIAENDSYLARLLAVEVLPEDLNHPQWPYTFEANQALRKSVRYNTAVFIGHTDTVRSAAFSSDSKRIVSASLDGTVRIWDAKTGKELNILKGHTDTVDSAAFSPDGKRIVSASWGDLTVRIWDAETGEELNILKDHTGSVFSAAFSPDSKRIVSTSADGTIRIWDAKTGTVLHVMKEHRSSWFHSAVFSPDGKRIISVGDTVCIWDVETGKKLNMLKGHTGSVYSVAFSPDGKRMVSGSSSSGDKTVCIWDAETGEELNILKGHTGAVRSAVFSPDGKRVVSASCDGTVRIWDAKTGRALNIQKGCPFDFMAFSPDVKRVVSVSSDNTIRIWDAETERKHILKGHTDAVFFAAFSSDGKRIVSASYDKTVRIWDVETGRTLNNLKERFHGTLFYFAAFSPNGKRIVSASSCGTVRFWDAETGKKLNAISSLFITHGITHAAFSPDGKRIASTSGHIISIWEVETELELSFLWLGIDENVNSVAFSPDGKRVVLALQDKTVRIWDVDTGKVNIMKGHINAVCSATFSPDGKRIVSASLDETVRIWDAETGKELNTLKDHTQAVYSATFSPDCEHVVSASGDNTVCVWDAETGRKLGIFEGHTGEVYSAVFSPDGRRIVSASKDGTIRIWDFPPLQELIDQTRERFKNRPLTAEERRQYYLE